MWKSCTRWRISNIIRARNICFGDRMCFLGVRFDALVVCLVNFDHVFRTHHLLQVIECEGTVSNSRNSGSLLPGRKELISGAESASWIVPRDYKAVVESCLVCLETGFVLYHVCVLDIAWGCEKGSRPRRWCFINIWTWERLKSEWTYGQSIIHDSRSEQTIRNCSSSREGLVSSGSWIRLR